MKKPNGAKAKAKQKQKTKVSTIVRKQKKSKMEAKINSKHLKGGWEPNYRNELKMRGYSGKLIKTMIGIEKDR